MPLPLLLLRVLVRRLIQIGSDLLLCLLGADLLFLPLIYDLVDSLMHLPLGGIVRLLCRGTTHSVLLFAYASTFVYKVRLLRLGQ